MSRFAPINRAYQQLLHNGRLQPNSAQQALITCLGQLQEKLVLGSDRRYRVFHDGQRQNGIYIYGGVGTGKSRIADLFASTLPKDIRCRRVHFHEFMVDVHSRLHEARSQVDYGGDPLLQIGRQIHSQSPVLCFDEFQVSDIADAMILKRLFGSFWECGGIMVSTSNRHPTQLYLNGLNRALFVPFITDIERKCLVWKMEGDQDYRLGAESSKRIPVFFTDSNTFSKTLSDMIGGASLKQVTVDVAMNRSISVLATSITPTKALDGFSKAVVYGTFQEFFANPLGTSDYHAICSFGASIFISGLRQFAADELDFVRRFVNLIDIAYESRTRIICFSHTPLSELFSKVGVEIDPKVQKASEALNQNLNVIGEGGSSSSMMSTFLDGVEWSATGLTKASLATGGAGETDVRFAVGRALSRLSEMTSIDYTSKDT